jgi:hypothetical protein
MALTLPLALPTPLVLLAPRLAEPAEHIQRLPNICCSGKAAGHMRTTIVGGLPAAQATLRQ